MLSESGSPRGSANRSKTYMYHRLLVKFFGAPKISSDDLNLQGTVEQIPDVLVPEMVEQLVKLSKTVSVDRIQQQTVEHITADTPVPQDVEEPGEFFKAFSQIRVQLLENPAIPLAEKIVELPFIQTEEKTRQSANVCAQHVVNAVEVDKSAIIEETVQRISLPSRRKSTRSPSGLICHCCSSQTRSSMTLLWRRDRFPWRLFRRSWRFPSCNTVMM